MIAYHDAGYLARNRYREQFNRLRFRGLLWRIWNTFFGTRRGLLHLADVAMAATVTERHDAGICSIPLDAIMGSEGRCTDFDHLFRPLQGRTMERWMRIALAKERGECLPVVDLIQLGEQFFVRDGHHRVSVARYFGQQEIEAAVTVWETCSGPSTPSLQSEAEPHIKKLAEEALEVYGSLSGALGPLGRRLFGEGSTGGGTAGGAGMPALQGG